MLLVANVVFDWTTKPEDLNYLNVHQTAITNSVT